MEKKEQHSSCSSVSTDQEASNLLQTLDQHKNWDGRPIVKYNGFWLPMFYFRPILSIQKHFQAKNSDIILTSFPKSGTTWLKALAFSISNRDVYTTDQSPLLTSNPHSLVPFLEFDLFANRDNPELENISSRRIFSTHIPIEILPESIRGQYSSQCKIIYLCRNPLDQFISHRQFLLKTKFLKDVVPLGLDEAFDKFCEGTHIFGPILDHILGYWNAHLKNPERVLFIKYEDLKVDIAFYVKKIAEFLGCPFSNEEDEKGLIEEIAKLCSFGNLKDLEVNKSGDLGGGVLKNSSFFRKGEVGDWTNYLTPAMAERFEEIMKSKLEGSGLMFNIQNNILK